jgi:hypothetical protein
MLPWLVQDRKTDVRSLLREGGFFFTLLEATKLLVKRVRMAPFYRLKRLEIAANNLPPSAAES